jgi:hypothetical protein
MRTTTLLAAAAALTIGAVFTGVELAQAQQLGTGSNALGSGGASIGRADVPMVEDQRAVAPAIAGDCVTNRTRFRTETNFVNTTTTFFVKMPNTHLPVTTSGGCLIVDFAGEVFISDSDNGLKIQAYISGIGEAQPSSVFLGLPAGKWDTRSMRFVFPNVPAGQHIVRIEYRRDNGGTVSTKVRTLTVQYRP